MNAGGGRPQAALPSLPAPLKRGAPSAAAATPRACSGLAGPVGTPPVGTDASRLEKSRIFAPSRKPRARTPVQLCAS